ncbi:spike base protein, RCAP_Rcc01079 family [Cohnella nanjingensis]|uniref:Uncharacterized protein n=1 Tax=Cohnella nanjingensis TaxID=1387779 RepID=A0A7X0RS16_9BACL|nr:hypothetical protein [Cohnella nanjingensis]
MLLVQDSANAGIAVTPSDTVDIAFSAGTTATSFVYVGGTGDLAVVMHSGATLTFKAMPVGLYKLCVKRINATGTTATDILALWS